jgi:DNA repair photolyase
MHEVMVKGILSSENGMNVYRGCTHGCIYCDSRSRCYQINHEFTDIEIKKNAPKLLEDVLKRKRHKCMIGTGAMCDPYMHLEEQVQLTRKCLEIIDRYQFGVTIITKSSRILRDLELLKSINNHSKCVVQMTLTTYDEDLCRLVEPNVSTTKERFEVLKILRDAGIPTVVWLSPILPYINDTEENIKGILGYCIEAKVRGIICFDMGLTLRDGNREYFYEELKKKFPGLTRKYIEEYGNSYEIPSPNNRQLMRIFNDSCKKNNILCNTKDCFHYLQEYESRKEPRQMELGDFFSLL